MRTVRRSIGMSLLSGILIISFAPETSAQWRCPGGPRRGGGPNPGRGGAGGGGGYSGPGDTVRPGPRSDDPVTRPDSDGPVTGPSGPSTPASGPVTGGPTGPAVPTGGPRRGPTSGGARGIALTDPVDGWDQWWEFNRDRFLQLRREVWRTAATTGDADFALGHGVSRERAGSLRPTRSDLQSFVVPLLQKLVDDSKSNGSLRASAMLSLARIGGTDGLALRARKILATRPLAEQEIAVLSLGVDGRVGVLADLLALARDRRAGRALVRQSRGVPDRVRAFATYACGLVAARSQDHRVKRRVFFAMRQLLDDTRVSRRDMHVAALQALRILAPDARSETGVALRDDAIHYLLGRMQKRGAARLSDLARAHCLTAMARLAGRADPSTRVARCAVDALDARDSTVVRQSAILALGEVGNREDEAAVAALRVACLREKNGQARGFATIALGQVGAEQAINFLRTRLVSPKARKHQKPWIAIALALAARDAAVDVKRSIERELVAAYREIRAPQYSSGVAIALGLLSARDAEDMIATRMSEIRAQGKEAGYHAVALGLMDAGTAAADIRRLFEATNTRDDFLAKAATALALLGDKSIVAELAERLRRGSQSLATCHALTRALGLVGDRRAISRLVDFVADAKGRDLPRSFATVALGMIGDSDKMPWNERIAANVNYRATVDTLSGASGVLDIL